MKYFFALIFILVCKFGSACNCLEVEINGSFCVNCTPEGWESILSNPNEDIMVEGGPLWPACHGDSYDSGGAVGMYHNEGVMTTISNLNPGSEYYMGFQIATCSSGMVEINIGDYSEEFEPSNGGWEDVIFCFVAGAETETLTIQGVMTSNYLSYVLVDYLPCGSYNTDNLDCDGSFGIILEDGDVCPGEEHLFNPIVNSVELDGSETITWSSDPPVGLDYLSDLTIIDPLFLLPEGSGETILLFEYTLHIEYLGCEGEGEVTVTIIPETIPTFSDFILCEDDDISILLTVSDDNFEGYWEGPDSFEDCGELPKEFTFFIDEGQGNCLEEYTYEFFITPISIPEFSFELEYCITDSSLINLPTESDNGISGEWTIEDFRPYRLGLGNHTIEFTPDDVDFPCDASIEVEIDIEDGDPIEFVLPTKFCKGDPYTFPETSTNGFTGSWSIPSIPLLDENGNTIDTSGFLETIFTSDEESCNDIYLHVFEIIDLAVDAIIKEPSDCEFEDGIIEISSSHVLEVSLDNGLTWQPNSILENLAAGIYDITFRRATDSLCVDNIIVELTSGSLPVINSLEVTQGGSCDNPTGGVIVNTSEVLILEFSLDGGITWQTNNAFENLPEGNYTLIARFLGSTNCYYEELFTILVSESPMINSIQPTNVSDCFLTDGSITVFATGLNLSFSIDNGVSWQMESTFQNLPSGSYTVLMSSVDDCLDEISTDIFEPILPLVSAIGTDPTSCTATDASIFITNSDPSVELEYSIDGGINWQLNPNFSNLSGGLYTIEYRIVSATSCTENLEVNLEILEGPEILSIEFEDDTSCSIDIGFIKIEASVGNEFSIDNGLTWQADGNFTGLPGGNYTVYIRSIQNPNCVIEQDVNLDEYELPLILSSLITEISDCGQMDGALEIIATGQDLEYSIDYGATWQSSSIFTNLNSGIYGMMIREASAPSCAVLEEIEIESLDAPTLEIVNTEDVLACQQNEGIIEATGTGNGDLLEFSIDGGLTWLATGRFENLTEGDYTIIVRYVDRPTCQDIISGSILYLGQQLSDVTPILLGPLTCGSSDGEIQFESNVQGLEYSIDGGVTFQIGNIFSGLAAGIFDCQVQLQSVPQCDTIFQIELIDPDCPCDDYNLSYETENIDCLILEGSISLNLEINESVLWEDNSTETVLQNLNSGWYYLTVNYDQGICFHQDSIFIDAIEPIDMTLEVFPSDCEGENNGSVVITETEGGDGFYNYSIDGISFQSESGFYNLSPNSYEAIVIDMGNCISREEFLIELSQQSLDIALPLSATILEGEEIVLNPLIDETSIDSFIWAPSEFFTASQTLIANVSPVVTTEFTLTIFYGNGCIEQRTIIINVEDNIHLDEKLELYFPNVIQFNNSDNDVFYIQGPEEYNGKIISMAIYDRWGNKVFFKSEPTLNNIADGWDGTSNKNLVQGVYVYLVKYEANGEVLSKLGTITLLK